MSLEKEENRVIEFKSRSSTLVPPETEPEDKPSLSEWKMCVHPQGWVYFFSSSLRVVTDQDIRDPEINKLVNRNTLQYPLPGIDSHMEVQLLVQTTGEEAVPNLFLVINHKECVASYDLDEVTHENVALMDPNTLNRRRRLYWNYLWNHPDHVSTPERAISDAADALTWFFTDNLISGARSIAPFSKTECEDLSHVVQQLSEPFNSASVSKTVFLAWLLREVCSFRDSEHYGTYTKTPASKRHQKRRQQPLNSYSRNPPPFILPLVNLVITFLCFGIPHTYYAHVKASSEYRGRLANVQSNWERYIERLVREYSHFLLISTVLLGATVGLLTVNDINEAAQVGAIVSALTSLGSIIVGVFSIWKHQTNTRTADSFTYMHNAQHGYLGFHGHAMLLSLPPVLLVWAIVTFTISLLAYAMKDITGVDKIHSASAWAIVGIFCVLLGAVIAALYTFSIIWRFQYSIWNFGHWKVPCWGRRRKPSEKSIIP